jgi:hypothetical protein
MVTLRDFTATSLRLSRTREKSMNWSRNWPSLAKRTTNWFRCLHLTTTLLLSVGPWTKRTRSLSKLRAQASFCRLGPLTSSIVLAWYTIRRLRGSSPICHSCHPSSMSQELCLRVKPPGSPALRWWLSWKAILINLLDSVHLYAT